MRQALRAFFCNNQTSDGDPQERARIENELRNDARCAEFFRKISQTESVPLQKAPEVFADESFPDPNIVAEYLDCQLNSPEICDEYERVCCESPEILAEVADCYDVLNNRLPTPASAPKNCRRRLYYVAWEEELPRSSKKSCNKKSSAPKERLAENAYAPRARNDAIDVEATCVRSSRPPRRKSEKQSEAQLKIALPQDRKKWWSWSVRGCLAFFIVAGGINSFAKWRSLESSQTFVAKPHIAAEDTHAVEESGDVAAAPSDYLTVSEEFHSTGLEPGSYDALTSQGSAKVASLSPEPGVDDAYELGAAEERVGLDPSGVGRREGLRFPETNNDVFSGMQRF
ncbi:MAG: hypothetical protein ACOX0A_06115 [Thermoguttaceae bacterium]